MAMLGFSAAACDLAHTERCEYGTPQVNFKIKGRVTDAVSGVGIEGIRMVFRNNDENYGDTIYTSVQGDYDYQKLRDGFYSAQKFEVQLKDVDGAANGLYEGQTVQPPLEVKDGGWQDTAVNDSFDITISPAND